MNRKVFKELRIENLFRIVPAVGTAPRRHLRDGRAAFRRGPSPLEATRGKSLPGAHEGPDPNTPLRGLTPLEGSEGPDPIGAPNEGSDPIETSPKTCSSQAIQPQAAANPRQIMRKHANHAAPVGILPDWTAFDAKRPRSKDDVFGVQIGWKMSLPSDDWRLGH